MDRPADIAPLGAGPKIGIALLVAGLLAMAYFALSARGIWPGSLEGQAREALTDTLLDPSSAQFRELRRDLPDGPICGEVNAKNSFGAYTGFAPFYAWRGIVFIDDEDSPLQSAANLCRK